MIRNSKQTAKSDAMAGDDVERIADLFMQVARAMWVARPPKLEELAFDLTMAQGRCLWTIMKSENCTLRELSQRLGVSPPTTSALVDRLVGLGLVVREADTRDRRVVRLRLDTKGQAHLARHKKARREHLRKMMANLSSEQRAAMTGALEVLASTMGTA